MSPSPGASSLTNFDIAIGFFLTLGLVVGSPLVVTRLRAFVTALLSFFFAEAGGFSGTSPSNCFANLSHNSLTEKELGNAPLHSPTSLVALETPFSTSAFALLSHFEKSLPHC